MTLSPAPAPFPDQLTKKSLRDEVFELLHQRIIAGTYSPGEWLRQEEISTQLGVSQTPVREALDGLVATGLAERVPYRGVRVVQLSPNEIIDAYLLRMILESFAVGSLSQQITIQQVSQLNDLLAQTKDMRKLEHMSQLRQVNRSFHQVMVAMAAIPLLSRIYEMVANSFPDWMLYEYMFRHPELLESSLAQEYSEHAAIVAALGAGDRLQSQRAVIQHIQNIGQELVSYLDIPRPTIQAVDEQIKTLDLAHLSLPDQTFHNILHKEKNQ